MTQQDDITQRVLTAEHHLNELMRLTQPWPNATIPCATVRSHVEQALSQVRAPVADERAAFNAAFTKETGIELCADGSFSNADDRQTYEVAKWAWETRAALASAPVAGEAQPVAVTDHQGDVHWRHGRKAGIALYAAPQASECECSRKSKAVSDSEAQL